MAGNVPGGRFVKGDPRINRKGRPKEFDALRELAKVIAGEPYLDSNGQPLAINGKGVTRIEFILRDWASSSKPELQKGFVEIAYGKVPDKIDLSMKDGKIFVTLKNDD